MASTANAALIRELDLIRTQRENLLKTAQEVGVTGAFQMVYPKLAELNRQEARVRQRLLTSGGAPRRIKPSYTAGDNSILRQ